MKLKSASAVQAGAWTLTTWMPSRCNCASTPSWLSTSQARVGGKPRRASRLERARSPSLAKTVAAESAVPILVLSAFATGLASLALRRSQRRFNREVSHHLTHLERLKTREVP